MNILILTFITEYLYKKFNRCFYLLIKYTIIKSEIR